MDAVNFHSLEQIKQKRNVPCGIVQSVVKLKILWNRFKNLRRKTKVLLKKKYDKYVLSLDDKCKGNPKVVAIFFHAV